MWLILTPCFLSQVIPITAFTAHVTWDVSPKQVEFGTNVTLTCTVHTTSFLPDRNMAQWGVKGLTEVICHKNCFPATDKYSPTIQYHASTFALVIHNFSETDLNVNYWCSYGLRKLTKNLTTDHISILKLHAIESSAPFEVVTIVFATSCVLALLSLVLSIALFIQKADKNENPIVIHARTVVIGDGNMVTNVDSEKADKNENPIVIHARTVVIGEGNMVTNVDSEPNPVQMCKCQKTKQDSKEISNQNFANYRTEAY